jgi:hypothetical protein
MLSALAPKNIKKDEKEKNVNVKQMIKNKLNIYTNNIKLRFAIQYLSLNVESRVTLSHCNFVSFST